MLELQSDRFPLHARGSGEDTRDGLKAIVCVSCERHSASVLLPSSRSPGRSVMKTVVAGCALPARPLHENVKLFREPPRTSHSAAVLLSGIARILLHYELRVGCRFVALAGSFGAAAGRDIRHELPSRWMLSRVILGYP